MSPAVATATTILGAFIASAATTWQIKSWLQKQRIVDSPNERSLHHDLTVTGGGIAVAIVLVALWLYLRTAGFETSAAVLIPVVGLSLIGLTDDIHNLGWVTKLFLQCLVAALFVVFYGPFTRVEVFGLTLDGAALNVIFSVLWVVALVNIFNFMDGIDGLAGGYSAICAGMVGVWFVVWGASGMSLFAYGIMAACLGFLIWNWAPAKIFLGDAGSMMLGGTLAAVGLIAQREYDIPLSAFALLYAVFIGDTTYTLIRRLWRGEKIWRAHREHVYQRAIQTGLTHSNVTGFVMGISAIICALASLEMSRTEPRLLWLALCLLLLWFVLMLVRHREETEQS